MVVRIYMMVPASVAIPDVLHEVDRIQGRRGRVGGGK